MTDTKKHVRYYLAVIKHYVELLVKTTNLLDKWIIFLK